MAINLAVETFKKEQQEAKIVKALADLRKLMNKELNFIQRIKFILTGKI